MHIETKQEKETSNEPAFRADTGKGQHEDCLQKVKSNGGAGGNDGINTKDVRGYLVKNWSRIREQIRQRKYKPQPVRRVEIPKPNGGVRNLGIPNVIDRIIEQAIAQVLTPIQNPSFINI